MWWRWIRWHDEKFINKFRLDLETGGDRLIEFNGYKNWFPGCTTYGFIRFFDADIYSQPNDNEEYKTGQVVLHYNQGQDRAKSVVEILDVLDGIDMNLDLRQHLQPMWHIRTNTGIEGYINANNVSDVFYKVKE